MGGNLDRRGGPLSPAPHHAEYKQVTVLFADVVRSMDIAAALDLERLREIMTEVVERSAAVVQRYGGTVQYNGDGVMAIFGAPRALEDHAFRACMAAAAIQDEMKFLAREIRCSDDVDLQVRVGLDSGSVIVGDIGAGSLGYAATGRHVGYAQRMESAAPPGAVMLSESTARLVEDRVLLSQLEWVRVKGFDDGVGARRLVGIGERRMAQRRNEAVLIGRYSEMVALEAMVDDATAGRGAVVNVVGPPGIGKSRVARETAALAADRGIDVCWAFCESHTDVPFGAIAQLLRSRTGVAAVDKETARKRVSNSLPNADPRDLLLLNDLLGIADPGAPPPEIDREARRRRLVAMIGATTFTDDRPVLLIVEDVQWIDAVSESLLADLLAMVVQTPSLVLITHRSEYRGMLANHGGEKTITLAPLTDSDAAALTCELLGRDSSVRELRRKVAEKACGNPFFAEEMVRELVQRGTLAGEPGEYVCRVDVAEVAVPATVQAAIEARIDRLAIASKRMLNAASVIGIRFDAELLSALGVDPDIDEPLRAELIEQVRFTPTTEYAFRHPLIRAVAYESQLKTDRAEWHRRVAAAVESRNPGAAEENAALIAEHLESAGDLHTAFGWHMRAATWSTNRDLVAARMSWERAYQIADRLPDDDPEHLKMRISPRAMLCATDFQARAVEHSAHRFAELRRLCTAADDKVSLAIGMSGPATDLCYAGRARAAAQLASEQVALFRSIDDPTPAMGLAPIAFVNWLGVGDFDEILRWSQTIVDLADGDPARGAGFGVGSPLALALAWRGTARWWLGRPRWRRDLRDAVVMARSSNPETFSGAVAWTYGFAVQYGVLAADDEVVRASEDALKTAHQASNDRAVGLAAYTLAVALLNRDSAAEHRRGLALMEQTRELWLRKRALFLIPVTDVWTAREAAMAGDPDRAIAEMRCAVDELQTAEHFFYGAWAAGVLVTTLLQRGTAADVAEAGERIDRLAKLAADHPSAALDTTVLRLRGRHADPAASA